MRKHYRHRWTHKGGPERGANEVRANTFRFVLFYFLFPFFELSLYALAMAIVLEKRLEYCVLCWCWWWRRWWWSQRIVRRTNTRLIGLKARARETEMKRYRNAHSWTFHKTFHSFTVIKFIIDDAFFRAFSNCLISFLLAYVEFVDDYLNTKRRRMNKWISVHALASAHTLTFEHTHAEKERERQLTNRNNISNLSSFHWYGKDFVRIKWNKLACVWYHCEDILFRSGRKYSLS